MTRSPPALRVPWPAADGAQLHALAVDADGTVLFLTSATERLLQDSREIGVRDGHLWLADSGMQRRLIEAVRAVAGRNDAVEWLSLPRQSGGALSLRVCGLSTPASKGRVSGNALLLLAEGSAPPVPMSQTLAARFRLTAAEANLAAALVGGASVKDFAARNGVSVNTVRTQVRHIFAKTGHRRQADFIRDVLG